MLLCGDTGNASGCFAMGKAVMKSVLLMTVFFGSGNFLTMKRGDVTGQANLTAACPLPKACPMNGYSDWFKVGSRCVKFFLSPLNFTNAEFSCRSKAPGGHLVSVHSSKANSDLLCIVIKKSPNNLRIWTGGFEFFQSGKFVWTDGSNWNYQIWTPGEPSNIFSHREDCVEMNWNHVGKWNDLSCSARNNFICAFQVSTFFDLHLK